ncbi:LPS translocon maturation chaperone LptM [Psychrobacter sp. NG27]|uniref:LPS translocon maturation chaperone LptM n=1 Tax=Psychrobacter sp. NG27 TaxID=2781966 RepID=UPI0018DF8B41|nr:lipoprotein [Psychrobacter sp. NG27]MBI0425968.1 lipoprotein [Psychrobacter sp. NG27]
MSTIYRSPKTDDSSLLVGSHCRTIGAFIIGSALMAGLSGCGQKGDLYLVDSASQTIEGSSSMLDSTSHPQDAAFAGLDGNDQDTDVMVLPEPSEDPNDY